MTCDINTCKPYRAGTHLTFISTENKCTHQGENVSRQYIRQFKIDGDVFTSGDMQRCDFLLLNDDKKTSYYIELKGSDLPKAIAQIDNTVAMISPFLPGYKIFRRIVYRTGTHKIRDSRVVQWQSKHSKSVLIKERKLEEEI